MQTTITINDQLFEEAAKLVAVENPDLLVEIALTKLIQNATKTKKPDVRELVGKVSLAPDYDYKKLRIGE